MSRIAYLISEYPAPSHTFIRREIAALRARGLDIVPFSIRKPAAPGDANGPPVEHVLGQQPHVYLLAVLAAMVTRPVRFLRAWRLSLTHRQAGLRGLLWSQFHLVEALTFARMAQRAKIARVHNHFANSGATVGLLAAQFLGLPWSLTLHGISETDHPAGAMLPDKVGRADFVACASWFMRAQAMRFVDDAQWKKITVVRCGLDLTVLPAVGPVPPGSRAGTHFICVGRLSPEKGYPGLLKAFGGMVAEGFAARLTIVGDGPLRAQVEGEIAALGLEDRVDLRGALSEQDTLAAIAGADALVLPSLMEGLPVVLMEAMALGKPVIASCVAGIPELVREGETGLLFRPSDWGHLGEQMRRLVREPGLEAELGEAGRAAVAAEFAIDRAVEPLVPLFAGRQAGEGPIIGA